MNNFIAQVLSIFAVASVIGIFMAGFYRVKNEEEKEKPMWFRVELYKHGELVQVDVIDLKNEEETLINSALRQYVIKIKRHGRGLG